MTKACDVLIRCDGGGEVGLGHVKRCLALGLSLRRQDLTVTFAGRFEASAQALIALAKVPALAWPRKTEEAHWLANVIKETRARALVLDIRTDLPRRALDDARAQGLFTLVIDDLSERKLGADIVTLPPTEDAQTANWEGFSGEALIGWRWTILSAPVTRATPDIQSLGNPPLKLLVTMGGADPLRLTERAASALKPHAALITPTFVIGPAFADPSGRAEMLCASWAGARVAVKPSVLDPFIQGADLALASYGVTAQELAAAGVPALYLCISDDHACAAEALAVSGAGQSLGRHDAVDDAALGEAVAALVKNPARRAAMASAGPNAIDGFGAERLAEKLGAFLGSSRARVRCN